MQVAANHPFMQVNQTPNGIHLIQTLEGISRLKAQIA